ncbi:hypothetical protein [Empedobacter tilapiae]|uniref:Trimeric autotransporter adhesin YadA-like head domain-containing protein n=1 Tax=Empedobacter tilapiae TaxID=2491114 RepID=A0A4Z1BPI8_9FLAO|nr:hypothetical protein [Empedobacter tilapiae]TGN26759.1 hypothetical protein E4J94_09950 [Empedobacter tilapiae]
MANIENQQPEYKYTEKSTLKNWFKSKLKPTQAQFWAWMDSYWHKGEKLPISTIDGLGEAVDGKAPLVHYHDQYATNDATSLSNENVEQWKKKLDVDNLQFDDQAISLTNEYVDFGLTNVSKQAQFNQAIYESNASKLKEPTYEGDSKEYPYLVGIDEEGYSAKISVNTIGKVKTVNNQEPNEEGNIELEKNEFVKNGLGWSTKYRKNNPTFFGILGENAVDLSHSLGASTVDGFLFGANGMNSFVGGVSNSAMGAGSVVFGGQNYSQGQTNHIISYRSIINENRGTVNKGKYANGIFGGEANTITNSIGSVIAGGSWNEITGESEPRAGNSYNSNNAIVGGYRNKIISASGTSRQSYGTVIFGGEENIAQGHYNMIAGYKNHAVTIGETLFGMYATVQNTSLSGFDYIVDSRIFSVGVGYSNSNGSVVRRDGLSIYRNGLVTAPTITNTLINNNPKALVTKEFVEDRISNFTLPTNWSNASHTFNAIPNKSKVATASEFIVRDSVTKELGYADGTIPFKSLPDNLTDFEKTEWKTKMNGGWTTATMSVGLITPMVIKLEDSPSWLMLKGANLNLNPTNFKIEIMSKDGLTVLATIPNSQVQLYTNGTDLTFWYNFYSLGINEYKIRLNNGIATYIAPLTFRVSQNIDFIDLSNNTWEVKVYDDKINSTVQTGQRTVSFTNDSNVKPIAIDNSITITATTKPLCTMADDFVIELSIKSTPKGARRGGAGITLNTDNNLVNDMLAYARESDASWFNSVSNSTVVGNIDVTLFLVKQGNILSAIMVGASNTVVGNMAVTSDVNTVVRVKQYIENGFTATYSTNIINAYKF